MKILHVTPTGHLAPVQMIQLSRRERQIAELVRDGKRNKEIAFRLQLTEGTVKQYVRKIFEGLGLEDRWSLARWAMRNPQLLLDGATGEAHLEGCRCDAVYCRAMRAYTAVIEEKAA